MVNNELARFNMVEQQIRPWNVLRIDTLSAFREIRRENFVPSKFRQLSFVDQKIPLDSDSVMLEPKVTARLVETLEPTSKDHILELGTGSGYTAAILKSLGAKVTSIEIKPELHQLALQNLDGFSDNIELITGDALNFDFNQVIPTGGFTGILTEASMPTIPSFFFDLLSVGGRLVGIEGSATNMSAVIYRKNSEKIIRTDVFETVAPLLINIDCPREFVF